MKHFCLLAALFLTSDLFSRDFSLDELDKHMKVPDFFKAQEYLDSFPDDSNNPDIIISRGWVLLSWGFKVDVGDGLVLEDGRPFPSGYPSYHQKLELRARGKKILEQARKEFPERIDAHLNLLGYYWRYGEFSEFKKAALTLFKLSKAKNHLWKNRGSVVISDPDRFLIENLQVHMVELQKIDSREAEKTYLDVAKAMTEFAPNHVYGYNNLGVMYKILKNPRSALPFILKAHELDPQDNIVMGNLTQTYQQLGDRENARVICKKMLAHPSGQFREWAEKTLRELQ